MPLHHIDVSLYTYMHIYIHTCHYRRSYILVDARRGAADSDGEMMEFMTKAAIPHQV